VLLRKVTGVPEAGLIGIFSPYAVNQTFRKGTQAVPATHVVLSVPAGIASGGRK